MKNILRPSLIIAASLLGSSLLLAAPQKPPAWAPIPIAPSWSLEKDQSFAYEALMLPAGPLGKGWLPIKSETLEGKVWAGRFSPGKEGTVLKERREIEQALEKAGFKQHWACQGNACSEDKRSHLQTSFTLLKGWGLQRLKYTPEADFWMASWKATLKIGGQDKGFGLVSIVGYTDYSHEPSITFYVVETKPFEATAKLDASSIGQALIKDGKVALPVNFDLDQSTVRPDGLRLLADTAEALRANTTMKVRIEGHTDAQGAAEHNQQLSLARAEAIKTILVMGGIESARLSTEGFGSSKPIAKGSSEADHAANRRVELLVVK